MAKARLDHIDGLRGIAALLVVVEHWGEYLAHHIPEPGVAGVLQAVFRSHFSTGRLGVVAFFCISGFVIPFSFRGERPLLSFLISRFFRLYPAYWLSILIAILLLPLVAGMQFSAPQVMANLTMVQRGLGEPDILGVYWTLLVELMFYAICFVLFAAGLLHRTAPNFGLMTAFLAVAIAGGAYRWLHPQSNLPVGLPTYLAAMHFGTLARLTLLEGNPLAARLYPSAIVMLAVGAVTANSLAYYHATNELVGWIAASTGYVAGLGLFLLCVHRRWFAGRTLAFLGLISYSVYLLHPIFLAWSIALWPSFADWRFGVLLLTPFLFGGTLLAATLAQRLVEAPMVRFGRRFEEIVTARMPSVGKLLGR